ncbi:MAG: hypothetical protein AB1491_04755 [Thermodesulfobacteriota bacterium]
MAGRQGWRRQGKKDLYFEEAQSAYLGGKSLEEIHSLVPVALGTLRRWHREGQWDEKRRQALVSPRWLGKALKGVLREKVGKLLTKGDLKPGELEELTKIVTLIDRLGSQGWDMRAAALEVMDRFREFMQTWVQDPEEIKRLSGWMQQFFEKLEDDGDTG